MDFEFETTRTSLANAFAAAGAELLAYQPLVSTGVAAIPDTQPQKYAIAGTLPGILQMAGKMMGEDVAEKPTGDLTDEQIDALWSEATSGNHGIRMQVYVRWFARAAIAAHLARQSQQAERNVSGDDASEGLQMLDDLIANIEKDGNYSEETTLTFLGQIRQCIAVPASQEGAHAAPNRDLAYLIEYIPDAAVRAEAKRLLAATSEVNGAHAARNAVLEEAAEKLEYMNDSAGDRAAHEGREMLCCESERMWTLKSAADAIRALKTPACAERSGDHDPSN